jgi:hypothetical protein
MGAICERCEQDMTEAETCTARGPRIRYGNEYPDRDPEDYPFRCPDCWVLVGGLHHVRCDKERCPICGDLQRLWCEHRYDAEP